MTDEQEELEVVRSYQRIFTPDRRVYQVDGKTLPVPGGVSLAWLGWALASLLAGLVLASGSRLVIALLAVFAAVVVGRAGRRQLAAAAAGATVLACVVLGEMLRTLDWPLRLIVMPALAAVVMTQLTPDGRPAHRYATGWMQVRLRGWRSAGRPAAEIGRDHAPPVRIRVASDEHTPELREAQVSGPASVEFAEPVALRRQRRRRRIVVRPVAGRRAWGVVLDRVRVEEGERLRVRS